VRKNWSLTPEQKLDARDAISLLGDSGLTLTSAVQLALRLNGAASQKTPLSEAVSLFLRERKSKLRAKSLEFYQQHLWAACEVFADLTMDDMTTQAVSEHLNSLTPSMASARFRSIRALWRWAMKRPTPLVRTDITTQLSFKQPHTRGDIRFLSVTEARNIIVGCPEHREALALMLFAGIRPEEVRGNHKPPLMWTHIDRVSKIVRIPADIAKTKQPRVLENLPDNLWQWLKDAPDTGPVCQIGIRRLVEKAQGAAGFRDASGNVLTPWPQDAMRHSFATYHVALLSDPGRTSLLLGHEGAPTMLYRHYRGLTAQKQAQEYFSIVP